MTPVLFGEVLLDSLLDTLKILPFLVVLYILIELMEHKTSLGTENSRLKGKFGVLIGSATGLIPQCGFSVMAAKLYDKGYIAVGTLLAIFISTSDEAFILLLSSGEGAIVLLPLILIKIAVGVGVGYAVNALVALYRRRKAAPVEEPAPKKADYRARVFAVKEEENCTSCGREHDKNHPALTYFLFPFLHALKIAAYVFLVTLAFGVLVEWAGEETLHAFLSRGVWVQPLIASAIGLIPNCASSVILTQSYLVGGITFGSCAAGLCANAGLGFVVLLKNTKEWKRNLILILVTYVLSVTVGYAVNGLSVAFGWL